MSAPTSLRPLAPVVGTLLVPYALAGALAFAGQCTLDAALRAQGPLRWLGYAAGLGAAAGALSGSAVAFALILLRSVQPRTRVVLVFVAALAFAAYAQRELGVVARLSGRYGVLAWAALSSIALLCTGFAVLALALTPRGLTSFKAVQDSWIASATRRQRLALLLVLLLGAAGALFADANMWVDEYAYFHELLRKSARVLCTIVLAQLTLALSWRSRAMTMGVLGVFTLIALAMLSSDRGDAFAALRKSQLVGLALSELRALGDVDADGFAGWLDGGDCAPFDPNVHPGAREVPGNGIDDNCHLGDLAVEPSVPPDMTPLHALSGAPSIVFITVDTLRADHVSAYGYPRATTPNIDRFFAAGTRFADAVAPGVYTSISMPSLMHGMYARHLKWQVMLQTNRFRLLPPEQGTQLEPGEKPMNAHLIAHDAEQLTLAQRMHALGYRTLAVVDDGGSSFLNPAIMGAGFEQFVSISDESHVLWDARGDERVADRALALLKAASNQPFFLWLHFYGVHSPSAHHDDVPSFGDGVIDRYDHEIASVDRQLGRVLAQIDTLQESRPMLALLTADHGESFRGSERAHGVRLNRDELLVPLFVRGAGFPPTTVHETVSLVDVVPSLMKLVTGHAPASVDGRALFPQPTAAEAASRVVFADVWRYDARGRIETERVAAVARKSRLVWDIRANTLSVYQRPSQVQYFPVPPELETAIFRYLERGGAQPDNLLE